MSKCITFVSYSFLGKNNTYKNINISKDELAGGAEVYLFDLADFITKLGHKVTVIQAGASNHEFEHNDILIKTIRLPGILKRLSIPEQWLEFNYFWPKFVDANQDIIHLHHAQHYSKKINKPLTATFHGVTWDIPKKAVISYHRETSGGNISHALLPLYFRSYIALEKYITKKAVRGLEKIASVDSFLLRFVQSELPDHRNKINVIYNYVDQDVFNPDIQKTDNIHAENKVILFPRNISFSRGAQFLVPAMQQVVKEFPSAVLLVVGDGNAKEYLINEIKKTKLEKNVILLGHKNHYRDMPGLFALSDVVIIPTSHCEGTSLSCLEAMACKKPVIATNIGGLFDIITHEHNGLMINPDANELGASIIKLLDNTQFAEKLAENGYKTIQNKFSKERWQDCYKEFFSL